MEKKNIDLIVPIYFCPYEDLVKCITSVWQCTDLKNNRLILPYNKKNDERSLKFIENITDRNILSIAMETDADFCEYINVGMKFSSTNDVVLLVCGSILTPNWLEKLYWCAYQEKWIGMVSPLCNKMINTDVENLTIDALTDFVEKYSLRLFPQFPQVAGDNINCIYIKRCLIQEIGLLDLHVGIYGYLIKALLMGYKYVMCDDTIVFSKKNLILGKNMKALEEKYQVSRLKECIENNSAAYSKIRKNIEFFVTNFNQKRNILHVLSTETKGINEYNIKDSMSKKYNIFILSKKDNILFLNSYIDNKEICFTYRNENSNATYSYQDKKEELLLERILSIYRIDLVHIFDICNMTLDIYYIANKLKIPIITSVQELNIFCPMRMIYNLYGKRCVSIDSDDCSACMKQSLDIYEQDQYINKCKEETLKALMLNNMILFCSKTDKVNFDKVYRVRVAKQIIEKNKWEYIYQLNFKKNKNMFGGG